MNETKSHLSAFEPSRHIQTELMENVSTMKFVNVILMLVLSSLVSVLHAGAVKTDAVSESSDEDYYLFHYYIDNEKHTAQFTKF